MASKNPTEKKSNRQHLKTLSKNSSAHYLRSTGRVIKYGTVNFGRNIWLSVAATLVMTVTLLVLLITVVASAVLTQTADVMRDKIDITIYFAPGTSDDVLAKMQASMSADSNVKSVTVSNSEQELETFLADNADNEPLIETLKDRDMRATMLTTMQSTMRVKVYDVENLDSIKFIVDNDPIFVAYLDKEQEPTYDANRVEIATVTQWANVARNGGIILGAVFLVISVLVIFNTIRMAIFSRREEIYMMKLVGADKSFIRGPFLVEAQLSGIVSGLIAATLGLVGFIFLDPRLSAYGINMDFIENIIHSSSVVLYYLVMVAMGAIIGNVSARLAISKYLNRA